MNATKHLAAIAVVGLGLGLAAAPAQARNDFANGFESELGRIAAHVLLGAGLHPVYHAPAVHYVPPPASVTLWYAVPPPRVHVYPPVVVHHHTVEHYAVPVVREHHRYHHAPHLGHCDHRDHRGRSRGHHRRGRRVQFRY